MKRQGNSFPSVTDFNRLCLSARKAAIGTVNRDSLAFIFDLERECLNLKLELETGAYRPGEYRTFQIFEPKPRTISASPFRDRVVHHSLCSVLDPVFERFLIDDAFACRVGRGTVAAIHRAQWFARKYHRYAKLDVRHFFETADHEVLKTILSRLVKDRRTVELMDLFIDKGAPGSAPGKGLPIGNLTSQNFANLYLGPFDHYMKEVVRVPGYVRYMDDILLFDNDRGKIRAAVGCAEEFMRGARLELKSEVCRQGPVSEGISFLGFAVFPGLLRLDHLRRQRFARKVRDATRMIASGQIDEEQGRAVLASLFGWVGIGDAAAYARDIAEANQLEF